MVWADRRSFFRAIQWIFNTKNVIFFCRRLHVRTIPDSNGDIYCGPHSQDGGPHHVAYAPTGSELLANDITQLAGDDVRLDEVECMLLALHRAGHLSRNQRVHLQARYLSETRP